MKWIMIPVALLLTACDPTPPPQPEAERTANPIFETQIKAMEKARAVEGQVMDAADAQRQQMDDATR
jgi:hypothetical protein